MAQHWRSILFWSVLTLLVVVIFWLLGVTLLPFLTGLLLAILLEPMVRRMNRRGWSRTLVCALVALLGFLVIGGLVAGIGPLFVKEARGFIGGLPDILGALNRRLQPIFELLGFHPEDINLNALLGPGGTLGKDVLSFTLGALNVAMLVIITPVVAFYLMRDWPQIRAGVKDLLPLRSRARMLRIGHDVTHQLNRWVRAQSLLILIHSVYHATGLSLVGLKYAVFIGVLTGILSLIPVIGNLSMFAIAVIVAITQFADVTPVLLVVAVFASSQLLETTVLSPFLVGKTIRMHPVVVLLAVLMAGKLFGFMGAVLALPAVAVSHAFFSHMAQLYKRSLFYEQA